MDHKKTTIYLIVLAAVLIIGVAVYLVLCLDPSDNINEYEFRPLTEEQRAIILEQSTATSTESLLTEEEESVLIENSTAESSKSLLTPEEMEAILKASTAPAE